MATLDYTVVSGDRVYVAGEDVPDDLVHAIENPKVGSAQAEDTKPKPADKKDRWIEYAIAQGVPVEDGATKDDIQKAVADQEASRSEPVTGDSGAEG